MVSEGGAFGKWLSLDEAGRLEPRHGFSVLTRKEDTRACVMNHEEGSDLHAKKTVLQNHIRQLLDLGHPSLPNCARWMSVVSPAVAFCFGSPSRTRHAHQGSRPAPSTLLPPPWFSWASVLAGAVTKASSLSRIAHFHRLSLKLRWNSLPETQPWNYVIPVLKTKIHISQKPFPSSARY